MIKNKTAKEKAKRKLDNWCKRTNGNKLKSRIAEICIKEMSEWSSTTKVTNDEITKFIDQLYNLIKKK
ncbi:MAG: hypothetical protein KJI69_04965 [Patescibacteria group bacterium]|nr:hypothetical protein [Patescibacteria group bacterium]